jgi:Xaa-Pro aminopeptidase
MPTTQEDRDGWTLALYGYPAYTYRYPLHSVSDYHQTISKVVNELLPQNGKIGLEGSWVPASVQNTVAKHRPDIQWSEAGGLFDTIRMVKSTRELSRLLEVIALGDVMQQAVREHVQVGKTEIEVFSQAKAQMELVAGARVPVRAALRGGCYSAEMFDTAPQHYELHTGDLLVSDLLPQWQGYWADSCSSIVVGNDPRVEQMRLHRIVREALEVGINEARPGIMAGELDRRIRAVVNRYGYDYPHHSGHGIGVSLHEPPYIWLDAPTILMEGMVIALEPGIYIPEYGGIRQEISMVIEVDGARVLSHNVLTLS